MLLRCARTVALDFLAPALLSTRQASTEAVHTALRKHRRDKLHLDEDSVSLFESIRTQLSHFYEHDGIEPPTKEEAKDFNAAMARIFHHIYELKPTAAGELWTMLDQRNLVRLFTPRHWELISRNIASSCRHALKVRDSSITTLLTEQDMQALTELCIAAAARGEEEGLSIYMATLLKSGKLDEVVQLFERFSAVMERTQDKVDIEEAPDPSESIDNNSLALSSSLRHESPSSSTTQNPTRARILLARVSVHYIRQDFRGALKLCLDNPIRFSSSNIRDFSVSYLSHDLELQKNFPRFVNQLSTARMVAKPYAFPSHITKLAPEGRFVILDSIYTDLQHGLGGPDPYIAATEKDVTPEKPIFMTEVAWCALISSFIRCKKFKHAEKVWDDLLRFQLQAPISAWTALIDGYANVDAIPEALTVWDTMQKQGVHPDALAYRAIINALCTGKRIEEALRLFKEFQRKFPDKQSSDVLQVYNTAVHSLLVAGRGPDALAIMEQMRQQGPKPDSHTYNILMRHFGRRCDFKSLAVVVKEMEGAGLQGDVFTFSTILSALLKAGRQNAADLVVTLMRKQGIQPNVATYSSLIDHQIRSQTEQGLQVALRLLQMMEQEQDPNLQPNEVTYTAILAGIYRGGWLSYDKVRSTRDLILERMKKRNLQFTHVTYHILIGACLDNADPRSLQEALGYYKEIRKKKMAMLQDTWFVILNGLSRREEWEAADDIVQDMVRKFGSKELPGHLHNLAMKIRTRGERKGRGERRPR